MSEPSVSPKNLEAEESVLGAMMISSAVAQSVVQLLEPTDFWNERHRVLYGVIADMVTAGISTDERAVIAELRKRGALETVGDAAYVITLADTCPNPSAYRHYCECIIDSAARRQIGERVLALADLPAGTDVRDALERASEDIHALTRRLNQDGPEHVSVGVKASFDRMMQARETGSRVTGLPTGFNTFDAVTSGMHAGNLLVVGGRTSMGKTSWGLNVAHHVALHVKQPVLIFSLEMSALEISQRLICHEARVDLLRYRTGDLDDLQMQAILRASTRVSEAPIVIDDTGSITTEQIRVIARQQHPALVVVDYLQLLYSGHREESRAQEVSRFARDLKVMAMELGIPVIAISQLRRPGTATTKREPSLEDLKESGGIEQNADIVVLLYRPEVDKPRDPNLTGYADMHIAKHRNGKTGKHQLTWEGSTTRFCNPDSEEAVR
jgi:replicative DNA helicase